MKTKKLIHCVIISHLFLIYPSCKETSKLSMDPCQSVSQNLTESQALKLSKNYRKTKILTKREARFTRAIWFSSNDIYKLLDTTAIEIAYQYNKKFEKDKRNSADSSKFLNKDTVKQKLGIRIYFGKYDKTVDDKKRNRMRTVFLVPTYDCCDDDSCYVIHCDKTFKIDGSKLNILGKSEAAAKNHGDQTPPASTAGCKYIN